MSFSIRLRKRAERRVLFAIAVLLFFSAAGAQPRWLSVPATPTLPAQTSGGHLDRRDALVWYAVYGDETKPAVLLLHGGAGSSDYWGHLIRDLMRDYRVIAMDSRGHGRSTNDAAALSYEQMAEDALALLDHLQIERAAVIGWSDGANIGFYLALRQPARISALVAFAGNATPSGYQPSSNPATMAAYVTNTNAEYRHLSPHPDRRAALLALLGAMWKTQPALTPKVLGAIKVPTLVLHAEHDEIIRRAHSREIATQIPDARFVLLPGVSHFALLQDPDGFNKAVRGFLDAR